jgi:hypothetical protein
MDQELDELLSRRRRQFVVTVGLQSVLVGLFCLSASAADRSMPPAWAIMIVALGVAGWLEWRRIGGEAQRAAQENPLEWRRQFLDERIRRLRGQLWLQALTTLAAVAALGALRLPGRERTFLAGTLLFVGVSIATLIWTLRSLRSLQMERQRAKPRPA